MGNLVRAELYRMRQRKALFWSFTGFMLLVPALFALDVARTEGATTRAMQDLFLCVQQPLVSGVFLAVFCSILAFSDQYRHGTLNNEAVFGIRREAMYLSRLAAAVLLGLFLAAAALLSVLLSALFLFPERMATLAAFGQLIPYVLGAVPLWIVSAALCLSLEFCCKSGGAAVTFHFLYLLFGSSILLLFNINLMEHNASSTAFSALLFRLLYLIHPLTPFFRFSGIPTPFSCFLLDGSWAAAGRCWLLGLGWVAATTLAAWLALRRRELR